MWVVHINYISNATNITLNTNHILSHSHSPPSLSFNSFVEREKKIGFLMFRERERVGIGDGPSVEISPNCPRCGSCNTKFCYYNNYSLTQPRYFCKGCRRYWTKGGSLRNVPVGGGCRKSRRCRSLVRVSSSTGRAASMGFARNGNILGESSSSSSSSMVVPDASSNIDLARVYADFLNQSEPETQLEMPELPSDGVDQSLQFASVAISMNTNTNTNFNSHFALDHTVGDYGLPPLPGEEVVVPPDMVGWPGSEMMVPNHFLHISQLPEIEAEARHLDQLIGNKSSFDMSSFGTFFRPLR